MSSSRSAGTLRGPGPDHAYLDRGGLSSPFGTGVPFRAC